MAEATLKEILKRRSDDTVRRIQQRRNWAQRDREGFPWGRLFLFLLLGLLVGLAVYVWKQAERAQVLLTQAIGDQPVQVYAAPLVLRPGMALDADALARELVRLGYRQDAEAGTPGGYQREGANLRLMTRAFRHAAGEEPSREVVVGFADGRLVNLTAVAGGEALAELMLDPMLVGSLLPKQALAETVVLRGSDLSSTARDQLLTLADPGTLLRSGVDYAAIGRALVLGGSRSYTQQLVRTLNRESRAALLKIDEVVMAAALEWSTPPERLFSAWLNHVHLGQDGGRAIRGVGYAAFHWFGKQATELDLHEIALLGVLARDPTGLDPRKRPDAARLARDAALAAAVAQEELAAGPAAEARSAPLGVLPLAPQGASFHPAYMALVRQHLLQEHGEGELVRPGIRVLTAFDPRQQEVVEDALAATLEALEQANGLAPGTLEGAAVLVRTETGEVTALVGGRDARASGRNRALDRVRPIGTLAQPAIWYAAVMDSRKRYDWSSPVEDTPVAIPLPDGSAWSPPDTRGVYRGTIPLWEAAVHATVMPGVRVGVTLGVPEVLTTLQRFGFSRVVNPSPSVLLGEVGMTPYEVAQMYSTLAAGGARLSLTSLRFVAQEDGTRVPRVSERRRDRALDPRGAYLVQRAVYEAARRGAARELAARAEVQGAAVQVGLTQGKRDGWAAGFDAEHVIVVWVGRDDDEATGFAGAGGALPVWSAVARAAGITPLDLVPPEGVLSVAVDAASGAPTGADCPGAVLVPYLVDRAPNPTTVCSAGLRERAARALRDAVN